MKEAPETTTPIQFGRGFGLERAKGIEPSTFSLGS